MPRALAESSVIHGAFQSFDTTALWVVALAVWRFGHIEQRWSTGVRPGEPAAPTPAD